MTPPKQTERVEYQRIYVVENTDGDLRLYRRREPLGLHRQDIFHPAGEWRWVKLREDGNCEVGLWGHRA